MKQGETRSASTPSAFTTVAGLWALNLAFAVAVIWGLMGVPAQALPSFARQTGQPCGTCHTDLPALTPYGRRFKLLGYTTGGGKYRTTPFGSDDATKALAAYVKTMDAKAPAQAGKDDGAIWV